MGTRERGRKRQMKRRKEMKSSEKAKCNLTT